MTITTRTAALAFVLLAGAAPAFFATSASAASTYHAECSARYKAAKAANTLAGMSWSDFEKSKCADLKASDASAPAAPAKATKPAAAATTTAAAKPASSGGTFMETCSASWKQMKETKTVPTGMKWKDFVKGGCNVEDQASKDEAATAPTEPTDAKVDPTVKTVDKNGKPLTAGQIALHQRIKQCGADWRAAKAAGKIPTGQTWPQYWSACDAKLKTAAK